MTFGALLTASALVAVGSALCHSHEGLPKLKGADKDDGLSQT